MYVQEAQTTPAQVVVPTSSDASTKQHQPPMVPVAGPQVPGTIYQELYQNYGYSSFK